MEGVASGQTFDRRHGLPVGSRYGKDAGSGRFAIQVNETCATLTLAATVLRTGQMQILTKNIQKPALPIRSDGLLRPVNVQPNRYIQGSPPLVSGSYCSKPASR